MNATTRVAAIDIGTNSVLLLIAERDARGVLVPVVERETITRLGQGVDRAHELAPAATERTLACLEQYAREIRAIGVVAIDAVGTSAMRDARGGAAFRAAAAGVLSVEPRVISGDDEARLTFRGSLSGLAAEVRTGRLGVFDIGGGSTELITGERSEVDEVASLDVGSVRLTERHVTRDPPSEEELRACREDIQSVLVGAPDLSGRRLIGVAGTVTTIAAIAREIDPYDEAQVHGLELTRSEVFAVFERLARTSLEARKRIRGLSPNRADVIVAGALLCLEIVDRFGAQSIVVSDRGVRWGLADELAGRSS